MGTRLDALARLALAEASSEPALQAKASALCRLAAVVESSPVPPDRLRAELRQVVETEALSARGLAGVLQALRGLERLDEPAGVWPSETPEQPAGDLYWPFCCTPAHCDQEAWRELDAGFGTQGQRDRWRGQLEGDPPWRHSPAG